MGCRILILYLIELRIFALYAIWLQNSLCSLSLSADKFKMGLLSVSSKHKVRTHCEDSTKNNEIRECEFGFQKYGHMGKLPIMFTTKQVFGLNLFTYIFYCVHVTMAHRCTRYFLHRFLLQNCHVLLPGRNVAATAGLGNGGYTVWSTS